MRIDYKDGGIIGYCFYIKDILPSKEKWKRWGLFKCECGKEFEARISHVSSNAIKSCGCLNSKLAAKRLLKHGNARTNQYTREYTTWAGIKQRCYDEKCKSYKDYGGRGIRMSDEWFNSFEVFLIDMGQRPLGNYSIERNQVNGDYCKENCRWATRKEQARNTRTNKYITYNGVTKCLTDWANELGIKPSSLSKRLTGWTIQDALTTPPRK